MKIFISYRREDSQGFVDRISPMLKQRFGLENVFKDVDSIHPGAIFLDKIRQALDDADVLLVVIGAGWLTASPPGQPGKRQFLKDVSAVVIVGQPVVLSEPPQRKERLADTISWFCDQKLDVYVPRNLSPWEVWTSDDATCDAVTRAVTMRSRLVVPRGEPDGADFQAFLDAVGTTGRPPTAVK